MPEIITVLTRGLASARPAAATAGPGAIYYSTDSKVTEQSDGVSTWNAYSPVLGNVDNTSDANKPVSTAQATADSAVASAAASALSSHESDTTSIHGITNTALLVVGPIVDAIEFVIDGGGSAITTGIKGDLEVTFACTITRATLLGGGVVNGSIVVDIWKDTYANYPPAVGDSITASAKPTITTALKAQDSTLTGWTTSIAAGDTLRFNVDSVTTFTAVTVSLKVNRT
jgi:hypothetical protein